MAKVHGTDAPGAAQPKRGRPGRVHAYLNLPHPWAVIIVMIATALFGLLATSGSPDPFTFALLLTTMLGGQIAIGAMNEYQDRHVDALVKPHRPIPSGAISPTAALVVVALGLVIMIVAGGLLGIAPLLLASIGTGAGLAYDIWFKGTHWSWLPYLVALPLLPIWVWVSLAQFEPRLLLLYPVGAPMVLAVHLAQSLPDAESDREADVGSLVAILGRSRALTVIVAAAWLGSAQVAVFGLLLAEQALPALLAGAVTLIAVGLVLFVRRRSPTLIDQQLFKVMTVLAVVLGIGWVLSVGV